MGKNVEIIRRGTCKTCGSPIQHIRYQGQKRVTHRNAAYTKVCREIKK